jgi:hypothetical protein
MASVYRTFRHPTLGPMRLARLTMEMAGYMPIKHWVLVPVTEFGNYDGGRGLGTMSRIIPLADLMVNIPSHIRTRDELERQIQMAGILPVIDIKGI